MDPLAPLIDALHAEGRLRVWSLVITVFGDSVETRGGRIATARLRALVDRIGIEEGALRTALSRLSADEWVTSERAGRSSTYSLTRRGKAEARAATQAIYRAPRSHEGENWTYGLGAPVPPDAISLGGEGWIRPGDTPLKELPDLAIIGPAQAGRGLARRIIGPDHEASATALRTDLAALGLARIEDPLTAAAARTLLIHRWRRLILRFPDIPDALLPKGHAVRGLRSDVAQTYARLSPLTEKWLGTDGDGFVALPPADDAVAGRFGLDTA